jgi:hypothetical protein
MSAVQAGELALPPPKPECRCHEIDPTFLPLELIADGVTRKGKKPGPC